MVKNQFFAQLGIVQLVRGWLRRRRFIKKLNFCDRTNKTSNKKYIVVCFSREPVIINKPIFKDMRRKGFFQHSCSWNTLYRMRVTRENLNTFFINPKTKNNVSDN